MAADRDIVSGRMRPIDDPERDRATRSAFLWCMFWITVAVTGHLLYFVGQEAGRLLLGAV